MQNNTEIPDTSESHEPIPQEQPTTVAFPEAPEEHPPSKFKKLAVPGAVLVAVIAVGLGGYLFVSGRSHNKDPEVAHDQPAAQSTPSPSASPTTTATDAATEAQRMSLDDKGISVSLPAGWKQDTEGLKPDSDCVVYRSAEFKLSYPSWKPGSSALSGDVNGSLPGTGTAEVEICNGGWPNNRAASSLFLAGPKGSQLKHDFTMKIHDIDDPQIVKTKQIKDAYLNLYSSGVEGKDFTVASLANQPEENPEHQGVVTDAFWPYPKDEYQDRKLYGAAVLIAVEVKDGGKVVADQAMFDEFVASDAYKQAIQLIENIKTL